MIVDNIFALMSKRGISAKELSEMTGISSGNISDWKSGKCSPKANALIKIADYLDCSVDYLLGRTISATEINSNNTISGNNNIIGNGNTVSNGFTEQQKALIDMFNKMDVVQQARLLTYAAELLK